MNSIDKLRNTFRSLQQKEAEIAQKIKDQENRIADLKTAREAAAESGDYALFESLSNDVKKEENKLYVLTKQAAAMNLKLNPEQLKSAWMEYAADYRKSITKKLQSYNIDRHKLCLEYEGLLKDENEALKLREELAAMIAENPESLPMDFLPVEGHQFPANAVFETPEARFFVSSGEWPYKGGHGPGAYPGFDVCHSIMKLHEPVQDPDFGH